MSIDLSQFHQVFFEESFEGLDIMESSLMELDPEAIDDETINAIFRSAHSIKGGSATFGFRAIAEFTHILETLLDQVRAGQRALSSDDINLFLRSVDCMRELLGLLQEGEDGKTDLSQELEAQFTALLNGESPAATSPATEAAAPESEPSQAPASGANQDVDDGRRCWKIEFLPTGEIFKTGNDPYRILRELSDLGDISVTSHFSGMPGFKSMDAEMCYLTWEVTLVTEHDKEAVEEIFEWVAEESDVNISLVKDQPAAPVANDDTDVIWHIEFVSHEDLLLTGNDPLKLFQTLQDMGKCQISCGAEKLPPLSAMEAEKSYLRWDIYLDSKDASRERILEVFEWVTDEASIDITPVSGLFDISADNNAASASSAPTNLTVVGGGSETAAPAVKVASFNPDKPPGDKPKAKPMAQVPAGKNLAANKKAGASTESSSIRVGIDKVDNLINMVGELVITQSMLGQLGTEFDMDKIPKLLEGLSQLEQNTRELQESVMRIRMLPISFAFSRFPRMVRDLSQSLGKDVNLVMQGEQTELDKTVMEKIGDPLVHLVRNAVDHGIEMPDERAAKGKNKCGEITLNAYHQGGNVVIEIIDDGKGLDAEKLKQKAIEKGVITAAEAEALSKEQCFDLIFQPGFSTAATVSDISGRGVGMDVVRRNIQALNGVVDITSEIDAGSTIKIRLPLTLAILDGQLVRVGNCTYIFPLTSIVESLQGDRDMINKLAGGVSVLRLRDDYVPIIKLASTFNQRADCNTLEESLLVVVESDNGKVAIVVDELQAQQQVVIKSLEQNYRRVDGISGATILGDGTVALILDIPGVVRLAEQEFQTSNSTTQNLFRHINEKTSLSQRA